LTKASTKSSVCVGKAPEHGPDIRDRARQFGRELNTRPRASKPVRFIRLNFVFGENLLEIGQALLAIVTETEKTAERFARHHSRLGDEGRYFRFSVLRGLEDIGLEEHKQKNAIVVATSRYVASQDVFKQMKACGNNLAERECTSHVAEGRDD
jgi:hypothetical protein